MVSTALQHHAYERSQTQPQGRDFVEAPSISQHLRLLSRPWSRSQVMDHRVAAARPQYQLAPSSSPTVSEVPYAYSLPGSRNSGRTQSLLSAQRPSPHAYANPTAPQQSYALPQNISAHHLNMPRIARDSRADVHDPRLAATSPAFRDQPLLPLTPRDEPQTEYAYYSSQQNQNGQSFNSVSENESSSRNLFVLPPSQPLTCHQMGQGPESFAPPNESIIDRRHVSELHIPVSGATHVDSEATASQTLALVTIQSPPGAKKRPWSPISASSPRKKSSTTARQPVKLSPPPAIDVPIEHRGPRFIERVEPGQFPGTLFVSRVTAMTKFEASSLSKVDGTSRDELAMRLLRAFRQVMTWHQD